MIYPPLLRIPFLEQQYPFGALHQGDQAAVPSLRPQSSTLSRWRALPSLQRGLGERYAGKSAKQKNVV